MPNTEKWPLQSECDKFYGNPRGSHGGHVDEKWYAANIVLVPLPFLMHMGDVTIKRISIHKRCAASLISVLAKVKAQLSADTFSPFDLCYDGSFAYRSMRRGAALSMHAYGCALDIDAAHNPMGKRKMRFTRFSPWVQAFEEEGWTWGGRWSSPDGMHFQAARVS